MALTLFPLPETESALPSGWKEISTSGVALSFPPDWKAIDLSADAMSKGGDAMLGNDPGSQALKDQVKQMASSGVFKVFVFDQKKVGTSFATNCNVSENPVPAGTTLEAEVEATKSQLGALIVPGTQPDIKFVDVKAGHAARIASELKTASPTNPQVHSLAYMVLKGETVYVVTFSCSGAEAADIDKLAEQVMESFKFTG